MFEYTKYDNSPLTRDVQGVKVRLANVFKRPEDNMLAIMNQIRELTPKDLEDFKTWFEAAGYPCNAVGA